MPGRWPLHFSELNRFSGPRGSVMSLDGAVWLIFGALTAGFLVSISDYEVGLFGYTLLLVPVLLYLVARSPIYGIFVLVPLSIFVSPAPQEIGYLEWVYISVFGLTLLAWVARLARWRLQRNRFTLPILSIYILILLSLFLRDPQGDFGRWIRGALPFLNLAMFFVVLSGVNKIEDVRWVVWIFHASAVLLILFVGRSV